MTEVALNLNEIDASGDMTGESFAKTLSIESIQNIIDRARTLSVLFSNEAADDDLHMGMANLLEALESYDLVPTSDAPAA